MKQFLVIFFLLLAIGTSIIGVLFFRNTILVRQDTNPLESPLSYAETQTDRIARMEQDTNLYNMAIEKQSKKLCEGIQDFEKRTECLETLIAIEAISGDNYELCGSLTIATIRMSCQERIIEKRAHSRGDKTLCESISGEAQIRCKDRIDEKRLQTILEGDTLQESDCQSLEPSYQTTCLEAYKKILIQETSKTAVNTVNPENCESIPTENERNLCLDTVNLKKALTMSDITECMKIIDTKKKQYCETTLSRVLEGIEFKEYVSEGNIENCSRLKTPQYKIRCEEMIIFTQVRTTKNNGLCSRLSSESQKQECEKLAK